MKLLTKEQILVSTSDENIILTNHRILMQEKVWNQTTKTAIFLEDISSVSTRYKDNKILLYAAALFFYLGTTIYIGTEYNLQLRGFSFLISLLCIVFWWFMRKHLIQISSKGGQSIDFVISQLKPDEVDTFIANLQTAKRNRVHYLHACS